MRETLFFIFVNSTKKGITEIPGNGIQWNIRSGKMPGFLLKSISGGLNTNPLYLAPSLKPPFMTWTNRSPLRVPIGVRQLQTEAKSGSFS